MTASMINAPASVVILDPDHHILTLEEKRDLRIELHVNKGRGFVLADQHELPRGRSGGSGPYRRHLQSGGASGQTSPLRRPGLASGRTSTG